MSELNLSEIGREAFLNKNVEKKDIKYLIEDGNLEGSQIYSTFSNYDKFFNTEEICENYSNNVKATKIKNKILGDKKLELYILINYNLEEFNKFSEEFKKLKFDTNIDINKEMVSSFIEKFIKNIF